MPKVSPVKQSTGLTLNVKEPIRKYILKYDSIFLWLSIIIQPVTFVLDHC